MVSLKSELSCGLATVVEERTNLATFLDTTATMQTLMAQYGYQVGKYFIMLISSICKQFLNFHQPRPLELKIDSPALQFPDALLGEPLRAGEPLRRERQ